MEMVLHTLFGGDLVLWVEQSGSIMIKAKEPHGDPIELSRDEARSLAALLTLLADEISS